jgi:predicted MPP superfamily phosphohydrolase
MAKRPTKRRRRWPLRLLLLAAFAALFFWWSNHSLQITRFDPLFSRLPEGFDGCRIAVIADLHSTEFDANNERLFTTITAEQPDYIFLVGDLTDRFRGLPEGYAETVADGLSAIAPTFYVTGNHEWALGGVR